MSIGKVVAVRHNSPASDADIQPGDLITDVDGQDVGKDLDPMRLPDYFSAKAGQAVSVKIKREARKEEPRIITTTITPEPRLAWSEPPEMPEKSVLSVPSLGLAFDVLPSVLTVDPEGPAAELKLQPGDSIVSMTLPKSSPDAEARKVQISEIEEGKPYSSWPFAFWLIQNSPAADEVTLEVRSPGTDTSREVRVKPVNATDWRRGD
jgi:regulator of sigma E protease